MDASSRRKCVEEFRVVNVQMADVLSLGRRSELDHASTRREEDRLIAESPLTASTRLPSTAWLWYRDVSSRDGSCKIMNYSLASLGLTASGCVKGLPMFDVLMLRVFTVRVAITGAKALIVYMNDLRMWSVSIEAEYVCGLLILFGSAVNCRQMFWPLAFQATVGFRYQSNGCNGCYHICFLC